MTLPAATFESVAPPRDGLAMAFQTARRRRNNKAAASGSAAVLTLAALLSMGGGVRTQTLMQEPVTPAGGPTVPLGVHHQAPAPQNPPAPVTSALPAQLGPSSAGPTVHARQVSVVNPARSAASEPSQQQRRPVANAAPAGPVTQPMTRTDGELYLSSANDPVCPVTKRSENAAPLCVDAYASTASKGFSLRGTVCNTDASTHVLTYPTGREVDMTISRAGRVVWRWSVGRTVEAEPHSLAIAAGSCDSWTTEWNKVDQQGQALPKGDYVMTAWFDADQLTGADRSYSATITIS